MCACVTGMVSGLRAGRSCLQSTGNAGLTTLGLQNRGGTASAAGKKYKTKYGMLVEIHITSPTPASTFLRSEITNKDVDDVRAMYLEHSLKPKDHKDLWRQIPDFTPMQPGDIMRPCREDEFVSDEGFDKSLICKFIKPSDMNDLPVLTWDSIFGLVVDEP